MAGIAMEDIEDISILEKQGGISILHCNYRKWLIFDYFCGIIIEQRCGVIKSNKETKNKQL
jgi:hypothetical protein